jgi:hypothetical protein
MSGYSISFLSIQAANCSSNVEVRESFQDEHSTTVSYTSIAGNVPHASDTLPENIPTETDKDELNEVS